MLAVEPAATLNVGATVDDDAAEVVICSMGLRRTWNVSGVQVTPRKFTSPLYTGVIACVETTGVKVAFRSIGRQEVLKEAPAPLGLAPELFI
jgi:hypothetical protein